MKRFVRPEHNFKKTALIVLIATALMVLIRVLVPQASVPQFDQISEYVPVTPDYTVDEVEPQFFYEMLPEQVIEDDLLQEEALQEEALPQEELPQEVEAVPELSEVVKQVLSSSLDVEKWREFAAVAPPSEGLKKIVIIIDDMGMSGVYTKAAEALPAPVTLAYLPYAPAVELQTQRARKAGHELLIHTPMEPMSKDTYPGPIALLDGMGEADINATLDKIFASFEGYIGINNHMGSRLTQNTAAMEVVMTRLAERGLLFVDSKTITNSVASSVAANRGLYFAERDVFLDHEETTEFVESALARLEMIAQAKGVAIAIGHPKKVTIAALEKWIPTLTDKGLVLVPVSDVVQQSKAVVAAAK